MWVRACQLKGLPVSIAREAEPPASHATPPWRRRRADKTVAGREKNRLCCPPDRARTEIIMSAEPVVIKQYAGRRLYSPAAGGYLTIGDLGAMVEDEEEFVVYDAKTGEDITHFVLKQIIVERAHHG
jgi:hypothetical protein